MIRGLIAATFMLLSTSAYATPVTYFGILFPGGDASFADSIVSYSPAGPNVSSTACTTPLSGGTYNDPNAAVGPPDYNGCTGSVSLGDSTQVTFGELIVKFTDNSLTTSGTPTPDLHIFEVGGAVEAFIVAISQDGVSWIQLGTVSGQPTSIDIDGKPGVVAGAQYSYVRLQDDPTTGPGSGFPFAGPDIDAIGAISSAPAVDAVPEPASLMLLGSGLAGMVAARRRRGRSINQ